MLRRESLQTKLTKEQDNTRMYAEQVEEIETVKRE